MGRKSLREGKTLKGKGPSAIAGFEEILKTIP